jgi:hypothetical protein
VTDDGIPARDTPHQGLPGPDSLGHPVAVAHDDVPPPVSDLSAYRRARQDRSADALICLFADVLGKPLQRRELTPFERARRENRRRERQQRRSS